MKAVLRARRLLSICALPVALWSASPSIRWCAITWADFPECLVRAPDGRCDLAQPSQAAGAEAPACDTEPWAWGLLCDPNACPANGCGDSERSTRPDDSQESSTRGFCIRGPVGGVGVKTELVDDSEPQPVHPLPVAVFDADVEAARPARAYAGEWPRPPTTPRASRPPVRAPPLA